jgi:DNA (cytosine-5)-methyltransferase 1
VFIAGSFVGPDRAWRDADDEPTVAHAPVGGWDPQDWNVAKHLPLQPDESIADLDRYQLSDTETRWISVWDELVTALWECREGQRLPGFPIWADAFTDPPAIPPDTPAWKAGYLRKNSEFYADHREVIDAWLIRHDGLAAFPLSRRKLEWQAQDAASLWDTVMHLRPSGIRAKRATYLPALVAITQTSVIGDRRRRITPREAARLQGMPDWFDFGDQPVAASYKQLGNAVNVGAAYHVLREHVRRDADDLADRAPHLLDAVLAAPDSPDPVLQSLAARH